MFALLNQVKQQFVSKYLELSMYWKITAIVTKQVQYLTFGAEFICTLFHLMYFFLCISKYQKVFENFVTFNRNVQCLYKKNHPTESKRRRIQIEPLKVRNCAFDCVLFLYNGVYCVTFHFENAVGMTEPCLQFAARGRPDGSETFWVSKRLLNWYVLPQRVCRFNNAHVRNV